MTTTTHSDVLFYPHSFTTTLRLPAPKSPPSELFKFSSSPSRRLSPIISTHVWQVNVLPKIYYNLKSVHLSIRVNLFTNHVNFFQEVLNSEDTTCGIGPCTPAWLQKFASKKTYVLVHGLIGMNTFALSSYFIGTISTLEKRFKISSQTSGEFYLRSPT